MILNDSLIDKIEEAGFSVDHEDGNIYYFRKFSSAGQDREFIKELYDLLMEVIHDGTGSESEC